VTTQLDATKRRRATTTRSRRWRLNDRANGEYQHQTLVDGRLLAAVSTTLTPPVDGTIVLRRCTIDSGAFTTRRHRRLPLDATSGDQQMNDKYCCCCRAAPLSEPIKLAFLARDVIYTSRAMLAIARPSCLNSLVTSSSTPGRGAKYCDGWSVCLPASISQKPHG